MRKIVLQAPTQDLILKLEKACSIRAQGIKPQRICIMTMVVYVCSRVCPNIKVSCISDMRGVSDREEPQNMSISGWGYDDLANGLSTQRPRTRGAPQISIRACVSAERATRWSRASACESCTWAINQWQILCDHPTYLLGL